MENEPVVGGEVTYVDPVGKPHKSLVTAVWHTEFGVGNPPGLNLVYVSGDEAREDTYGRQIERVTSVVHRSGQPAAGNYWIEKQ